MKSSVHAPFIAASFLAAAASPASAQMFSDSYVGVNLGAAFPPDQDIDGTFGDDTAPDFALLQGRADFDPGFFGSVVIGGTSASGLGAELEGFYHALNPNRFGFNFDTMPTEQFFTGDGSVFGGLVNVTYTFAPTESRWRPRIGGGVGYARITFDIDNAFDDGDSALAYQGFAGIGYRMTDRLELQLNGRYLGLANAEFDDNDFVTNAHFHTLVATVGFMLHM